MLGFIRFLSELQFSYSSEATYHHQGATVKNHHLLGISMKSILLFSVQGYWVFFINTSENSSYWEKFIVRHVGK